MRSRSPKGRGNCGWQRVDLDLAKAEEMLRDYAGPCKGGPLSAVVFRDRLGRHRRILAEYAENWTLQVNFTVKGAVSSYSLSTSLKVEAQAGP